MKKKSKCERANLRRDLLAIVVCSAFLSCLLIFPAIAIAQVVRDGKGVGVKLVTQLPSREKRWALILGIDKYREDISSLKGAVNDAKALKDVLVNNAGFPENQIVMLTTGAANPDLLPTRANILDELNILSYRVPEDGLLLFAFSGHGVSIGSDAYLIPSDGRITKNLSLLRDLSIDVQRIKEVIKEIKVKQVLMLLDACRNELGKGETANPLTEAFKRGFSFDVVNSGVKAFATLYATSLGERAFEFYDKETGLYRGYFSYAIEEGLKGKAGNGNGKITLRDLINYVENTVPKRVQVARGENQEPFNEIAGYKENELVLSIPHPSSSSEVTSKNKSKDKENNSSPVDSKDNNPSPDNSTELDGIKFDLISCNKSGGNLICNLQVSTSDYDKNIMLAVEQTGGIRRINIGVTHIVDDLGNEFNSSRVVIGNKTNPDTGQLYSRIITGIKIPVKFTFENINLSTQKIALFEIRGADAHDKPMGVKFREIPVIK